MLFGRAALAVLCAIAATPQARAQIVAEPVTIRAPAQITRDGASSVFTDRNQVQVGDILQTGATGQIQLRFFDETRIAIGPNSTFLVEDITRQNTTTADKFLVNTVRGAFRFISGASPQDAYSVRTPTATLGIRGTIFDVAVVAAEATDVILHDGEVRICSNRGGCAVMIGSCAYVNAPGGGGFETAQDKAAFAEILQERFPFVLSQGSLRQDFRAPVENCGRVGLTVISQAADSAPVSSPPASPAPPAPNPEPPAQGGGFTPPGAGGAEPGTSNPTPGQGGTPPGRQEGFAGSRGNRGTANPGD
jgi:hypothetical protein